MSGSSEAEIGEIAVVHLLRKGNEPLLFKRFIDSLRTHSAGTEHTLVILFKGFRNDDSRVKYRAILADIPYHTFDVNDEGLDITAYLKVATALRHQYRYFCFLNSHSEILCDGWLEKLYRHIKQEGIGLAGATGLWSSHRGTLSTPALLFASLRAALKPYRHQRGGAHLGKLMRYTRWLLGFSCFPNPHLRTNAFIIRGETLLAREWPPVTDKASAYSFESGRDGVSDFVRQCGLAIVMVDRDGTAWPEDKWNRSELFFQGEQSGLLVADNQTRQYQNSSTSQRQYLHDIAWLAPQCSSWPGAGLTPIDYEQYDDIMARQQAKLLQLAESRKHRLAIYGAGAIGNQYRRWLEINAYKLKVVAWVDSHISNSAYNGEPIYPPQALFDDRIEWDYVLIASNRFYDEIYEQLTQMGIISSKII